MATRISQEQLNKFISPEAAMAPYQRAQEQKLRTMQDEAAMQRQLSEQDARLAQLIKGKQIDEEQAVAKQERDLGATEGLRQLLGKDASVRVGEVSIDPRNYDAMRFAQGLADKDADNERLETAALQNEYNKLSGKSRDQLQALKEIEDLITNPSAVSEGQLRTAMARAAGDVGALSEGDVNRTLPRTLGADLRGIKNYVTGGTDSRLSPDQLKAVQDLVRTKRAAVEARMAGSGQELRTRSSTLAPTLSRKNKTEGVLQGLGVGASQGGQGSQLDAVMRRIQELEAKKAGR